MSQIWDKRFIKLAEHIASWSKDPSTKCGAVIVKKNKRIISVGYNGFPQGVKDIKERLNDRSIKYPMVVHAEANAILFSKEPLDSAHIYVWPFFTCSRCAGLIIQSGIKIIAYPQGTDTHERWNQEFDLAKQMYRESGVYWYGI